MIPSYRTVPCASVTVPAWGWKYDDPVAAEKLATSMELHGQLRAVVARKVGDGYEVIRGRAILAAAIALGWPDVAVCDVGDITPPQAVAMALALQLEAEVDYAKLAAQVAALLESGEFDAAALARCAPFDQQQVAYFCALASFDWSQFSDVPDGQHGFDWDAEPAMLAAAPPDEPDATAEVAAAAPEPEPAEVPPAVQAAPEPEPEPDVPPPPAPPPAKGKRAEIQPGLF